MICVLGSPAIGERFSPAKDCSDIADNLESAVDGFYWIKLPGGKVKQVNKMFLGSFPTQKANADYQSLKGARFGEELNLHICDIQHILRRIAIYFYRENFIFMVFFAIKVTEPDVI